MPDEQRPKRTRADRGVYDIGPCKCGIPDKPHRVYDLVVSTGRDPITGGYPQVWKRHHGNVTSARTERLDLLGKAKAGQLRRSSATLAELVDAWLADLERREGAPKTVKGYRANASTYWSALYTRPISKITRADVKQILDALTARGVGTVNAISTISAAFTWAVQEDWLPEHQDPTKKIRRSKKVNRLPKVPTPAHVRAVLEEARRAGAAPAHDKRYARRPEMERFIFLGAVTGCRSSELRGLRVSDVDLDLGLIGLVRAMSAEQEWTLKNRSERPVGLDEVTVEVVRAQVRFLQDRAQAEGLSLRPDAFLFSDDPTGREHWREDLVTKMVATLFDHASREEGVTCEHKAGAVCPKPGPLAHFTFKHLRKFMDQHGTMLGFTTNEVAARAGHDPSVARKHYIGASAERDRELAAGLAGLISPGTDGAADFVTDETRAEN